MRKKLLLVLIFLMGIYCISAVCAADVNGTSDNLEVADDCNVKLSGVDDCGDLDVGDDVKLSGVDDCDSSQVSDEGNPKLSGVDDCDSSDSNYDVKLNESCNESSDSYAGSDLLGIAAPPVESSDNSPNHEVSPSMFNVFDYSSSKMPFYFDDLSTVSLNKDVVNFYLFNSNDMNNLFKFIRDKNPTWGMLNITMAPNTVFNVCHDGYEDYDTHYAARFACPFVKINGNQESVIQGDGNAFAYVVSNCNVGIVNVTFERFNKCFINSGTLYCLNTVFRDNTQIISNRNSLCFEGCTFNANKGLGCLLQAEMKTFNVFYDCNFNNCCKDLIKSEPFADIVVYTKTPLTQTFDGCDIVGCTLTFMAIDKDPRNLTVRKCVDSRQLFNAMIDINKFRHPGETVINLENKEYEIASEELENLNIKVEQTYPVCLNVDVYPVIINGNGATIKLTGDNNNIYNTFAKVGVNGILIINNLTLSNFNIAFWNLGKLIVSNSSIVSDRTSDYISFHAVFAEGGETYFTGCDFKFDSGSSFSIDESKLYLKDCNFNTDSLGLAQDSVIYCSYQWMLKLDDKSRNIFNEYHYNGDITYKNHTYNSKNPFIITIKNPYYFSEVKDYLTILDPSVMIMNILCDCVIYLEEYSSLQHVVIVGNGHNVLFKPCKIAETLQVSIYNLTFENYNFTGLFENEGALKFNNCSFMHNSFKDPASSDLAKNCFIYNRGSCVFENCTFGNNDVKTLIVNEGLLAISNSSFWNNSVQGVSDSKK